MRELSGRPSQAEPGEDEAVVEIGETGPAATELEILHQVSGAIVGQLDLNEIASVLLRELGRALPALSLDLVVRGGGDRLNVVPGAPPGEADTATAEHTTRLARRVIVESRARRSDEDADASPDGGAPGPGASGPSHWLAAPMIIGNDVAGAIVLRRAARPFTDTDERLLGRVASLGALMCLPVSTGGGTLGTDRKSVV